MARRKAVQYGVPLPESHVRAYWSNRFTVPLANGENSDNGNGVIHNFKELVSVTWTTDAQYRFFPTYLV